MIPFTILVGLPYRAFMKELRVRDLKIEKLEVLYTNSTALCVWNYGIGKSFYELKPCQSMYQYFAYYDIMLDGTEF
jgi:hypothetical protein